jgi:hypothetical protein
VYVKEYIEKARSILRFKLKEPLKILKGPLAQFAKLLYISGLAVKSDLFLVNKKSGTVLC